MNKKNLILYSLLGGVLGLTSVNTANIGSNHVKVVEEAVVLADTATKLVVQNKQLKQATDSLIQISDSLQDKVEILETKVEKYENKITKVISPPPSDPYIRQFEVVVPIDDEIPSSKD